LDKSLDGAPVGLLVARSVLKLDGGCADVFHRPSLPPGIGT
jgi:hypothetical protein